MDQLAFTINQNYFPPAAIYGGTATNVTGFGKLATDIIWILVAIAASLTFAFIVIAGIKYVTSGGDEKKLASAHSTLTYALIGIAVIILAFVILRVVQFFIGSNVPVT